MFATASLAKRIERAEATLAADSARAAMRRLGPARVFIREISGGAAVFSGSGSPFNKVAGIGFDGIPDEWMLEEIERAYAAHESPIQFEVSSLGDPEIPKLLTRRGYELAGFENVLGRSPEGCCDIPPGEPDDLVIERVGLAQHREWCDAVLTGFLHPDTVDGPPSHESFEGEVLGRIYDDMAGVGGFERQVARIAGSVAGGSSLRLFEGIAQLCGAATLPAFRRRGVQSALLRYRLAESARRGCDTAVVTTQPASKSQQNVQRAGFELLYVRAILRKQS